jgi:hypothetical protein
MVSGRELPCLVDDISYGNIQLTTFDPGGLNQGETAAALLDFVELLERAVLKEIIQTAAVKTGEQGSRAGAVLSLRSPDDPSLAFRRRMGAFTQRTGEGKISLFYAVFLGYRRNGDTSILLLMYHLVVFVMQLSHRFIRPSYHQFTGTCSPLGQPFAYFDLPGVMPRRFGQQFPDMRVSRFGNTSLVPSASTGKLTGYQPQVGHKRPGTGKPPKVPYLTYQGK